MTDSHALIASFTESHLNHNIKDAEVHINNYDIIRTDRTNRKKGGVITYIREELTPETQVLFSNSNTYTEAQLIYIKKLDLIFTIIYRPPDCPIEAFLETINAIRALLDTFTPQPTLIITGDFNLPIIDWSTDSINGGSSSDRSQALHLQSFVQDFFLTQVITTPTRQNNILDLFFTNNEDLIYNHDVFTTNLSDHNIIKITTNINSPVAKSNYTKVPVLPTNFSDLNFFSQDVSWDGLCESLNSTDWSTSLDHLNPNEQLDSILDTFLKASIQNVPPRSSRNTKSSIIPKDRRLLMRKRGKLRKKLNTTTKNDRFEQITDQISSINAALVDSTTCELAHKEAMAVKSIKENPKYFYTYAFNKSKIKTPVGPLEEGDKTITDPQEISEILRKQYETVFSIPLQEKTINCPVDFFMSRDQTNQDQQLRNITINTTDIIEAIKTLSNNSAAGPDHIPAIFLKRCAGMVAKPLLILYQNSLATGIVPQLLRSAKITPVFKGGSRGEAKNYRPIALTSHIIKVLEKIITNKITTYLEDSNKMNDGQHGFRRGRSCLSQLLAHHDRLISSLELNTMIDVVYLDFSKAFDKVDHGVLLHKLRNLGISGQLGLWVSAFLTNRTQFVAVSGAMSSVSSVLSGVPQGSVLGPLLFLVHIHDIDSNITNSTVTSFADDTRITKVINTNEDTVLLQNDLEHIYEWAYINNMKFNNNKFDHLRYSTTPTHIPNASYEAPDGSIIATQPYVRDLGVCLSNDATFSLHITNIVKKARGQMGWILRTFKTRDHFPMLTLYKSLVIPLLEYCCQLWSPWRPGDIQALESVQRSFTYRISTVKDLNYWGRINSLKLYSLERRRERYLIIYVWKIMRGLCSNDIGLCFHEHQRLGRLCNIGRVHPRALTRVKTLRSNSFSIRGPGLFNSLPRHIRALTNVTLDQFKARLDQFLQDLPDEPQLPHYYSRAPTNSIIDWLALRRADGDFTYPGEATHRDPEAQHCA